VDALLAKGLICLSVLDVSSAAIARSRARLGSRATSVQWIEADVTSDWNATPVDIWHDRATFHFLTDVTERAQYRAQMLRQIRPGGHAILATFGTSGPPRCSGLTVVRYSPKSLAEELGSPFELVDSLEETHLTPSGSIQPFTYCVFRMEGAVNNEAARLVRPLG
jgi:hypothetical protein